MVIFVRSLPLCVCVFCQKKCRILSFLSSEESIDLEEEGEKNRGEIHWINIYLRFGDDAG